jgi:hypothetical protein
VAHQKLVGNEWLFASIGSSFPLNWAFSIATGEQRLRGELPKRRKIGQLFAPNGTNISRKGIGNGLGGKRESSNPKKEK